ncbi:hypothetical protein Cgig2_008675 [Carnegiea gigantea]|uniref:Uncharacterized protein n=1 Tax=Carnegiea gigantea TaxID=171969 RepID=A0A9Q1JWX5_9CARY|nr:hypothetical protein Cgig2_008675 [Carnegiea gigantea]
MGSFSSMLISCFSMSNPSSSKIACENVKNVEADEAKSKKSSSCSSESKRSSPPIPVSYFPVGPRLSLLYAQIIGLFADDKLGQTAMVSSLQHATLTRSAPGHCSCTCRAFDSQIYGFSVIMYLLMICTLTITPYISLLRHTSDSGHTLSSVQISYLTMALAGGSSTGWSFTLSLPSQYRGLLVLALHYGFNYGKPDLTILALIEALRPLVHDDYFESETS